MVDPEAVTGRISLGVIPSEIASDLDEALGVAAELGISQLELSEVDGVQLLHLGDGAARARERIEARGFRCRVVGAQTFKPLEIHALPEPLLDARSVRQQLDELDKALRAAVALGAPTLRLYGFRKANMVGLGNPSPIMPDGGVIPATIVERAGRLLREAGDRARAVGVTLAIENVRSCWANTGVNTGRLVRAADHPAVRVCWDPANDYVAGGDPAGSGFAAVAGLIAAAHLKDALIVDRAAGRTAWAPICGGVVDAAIQLRLLAGDRFHGLASLETHYAPPGQTKADGTRLSWRGLMTAVERAGMVGATR